MYKKYTCLTNGRRWILSRGCESTMSKSTWKQFLDHKVYNFLNSVKYLTRLSVKSNYNKWNWLNDVWTNKNEYSFSTGPTYSIFLSILQTKYCEKQYIACKPNSVYHFTRPDGVRRRDNWAVVVSWTRCWFFFFCASFRFHLVRRALNSWAKYSFQLSGKSTIKKPIMIKTMPDNFLPWKSIWYTLASTTEF